MVGQVQSSRSHPACHFFFPTNHLYPLLSVSHTQHPLSFLPSVIPPFPFPSSILLAYLDYYIESAVSEEEIGFGSLEARSIRFGACAQIGCWCCTTLIYTRWVLLPHHGCLHYLSVSKLYLPNETQSRVSSCRRNIESSTNNG